MTSNQDERFWAKVIKGPRPDDCWLWTGAVSDDGYGHYWIKTPEGQKVVRPQRHAHTLLTGEQLPVEVILLHSCDVPLCVRSTGGPDSHTRSGTRAENLLDRSRKRRHANAYIWRWRGIGRANFVTRSRELRDALREHGWEESIIRPLISGHDLDAPRLSSLYCSRFSCYTFGMGIEFTPSADRHGIPHADSLYAMTHAEASAEVEGMPGETTMVYIGRPHGQTDRYLEVIAAHRPPRTVVIFHSMELTDLYRDLLTEGKQ